MSSLREPPPAQGRISGIAQAFGACTNDGRKHSVVAARLLSIVSKRDKPSQALRKGSMNKAQKRIFANSPQPLDSVCGGRHNNIRCQAKEPATRRSKNESLAEQKKILQKSQKALTRRCELVYTNFRRRCQRASDKGKRFQVRLESEAEKRFEKSDKGY